MGITCGVLCSPGKKGWDHHQSRHGKKWLKHSGEVGIPTMTSTGIFTWHTILSLRIYLRCFLDAGTVKETCRNKPSTFSTPSAEIPLYILNRKQLLDLSALKHWKKSAGFRVFHIFFPQRWFYTLGLSNIAGWKFHHLYYGISSWNNEDFHCYVRLPLGVVVVGHHWMLGGSQPM